MAQSQLLVKASGLTFTVKHVLGYGLARSVLWNIFFSIDKDSIPSNQPVDNQVDQCMIRLRNHKQLVA